LIVHRLSLGHSERNFTGFFLCRLIILQFLFVSFFYRELLNTKITNGTTGNIAFNDEGDRVESLYEIVNVQDKSLKIVGTYRTNTVS